MKMCGEKKINKKYHLHLKLCLTQLCVAMLDCSLRPVMITLKYALNPQCFK